MNDLVADKSVSPFAQTGQLKAMRQSAHQKLYLAVQTFGGLNKHHPMVDRSHTHITR